MALWMTNHRTPEALGRGTCVIHRQSDRTAKPSPQKRPWSGDVGGNIQEHGRQVQAFQVNFNVFSLKTWSQRKEFINYGAHENQNWRNKFFRTIRNRAIAKLCPRHLQGHVHPSSPPKMNTMTPCRSLKQRRHSKDYILSGISSDLLSGISANILFNILFLA